MTDTIRITFPEGGAWTAYGFGLEVEQAHVESHIKGNAPHCRLIELIEPVVSSEPGDEPLNLGNGEWECAGWDGDDLLYRRNADQ